MSAFFRSRTYGRNQKALPPSGFSGLGRQSRCWPSSSFSALPFPVSLRKACIGTCSNTRGSATHCHLCIVPKHRSEKHDHTCLRGRFGSRRSDTAFHLSSSRSIADIDLSYCGSDGISWPSFAVHEESLPLAAAALALLVL